MEKMENWKNQKDASAVLFDDFGHLIDAIYYNQLKSDDSSVVHSGDSKTGEGILFFKKEQQKKIRKPSCK